METVLEEMRRGDSVSEICRRYALGTTVGALRTEIERWRHRVPEFGAEYAAILDEKYPDRLSQGRGRPTKEETDAKLRGWKMQFCEDLIKYNGSRNKAAARSPYTPEYIYQMLDESYPAFDQEFYDLVHVTEMRLAAELEGGLYEDWASLGPGKDRAWIAMQILPRRQPKRWSKQLEMIHSGSIKHEHNHQLALPKNERLALLAEQQQKFFATEPVAALPADTGGVAIEDVIDAEYVTEPSDPVEVR